MRTAVRSLGPPEQLRLLPTAGVGAPETAGTEPPQSDPAPDSSSAPSPPGARTRDSRLPRAPRARPERGRGAAFRGPSGCAAHRPRGAAPLCEQEGRKAPLLPGPGGPGSRSYSDWGTEKVTPAGRGSLKIELGASRGPCRSCAREPHPWPWKSVPISHAFGVSGPRLRTGVHRSLF